MISERYMLKCMNKECSNIVAENARVVVEAECITCIVKSFNKSKQSKCDFCPEFCGNDWCCVKQEEK